MPGSSAARFVDRLAAALGVENKREKVAGYYHEMEQGLLPAAGVSDRVLEALGRIIGETAHALRDAGRALTPSGEGPPTTAAAFARRAYAANQRAPHPRAPSRRPTANGTRSTSSSEVVDDRLRWIGPLLASDR